MDTNKADFYGFLILKGKTVNKEGKIIPVFECLTCTNRQTDFNEGDCFECKYHEEEFRVGML